MKFVAEIPARFGSKRVPKKNLRLINGKPMLAYAIEACKNSRYLDEVYVNTENDEIGKAGTTYGARYYKRSEELAGDTIVSDQFNYDFLKNTDCDAVVMVNPVSPLVISEDIDGAIEKFQQENLDTLISTRAEKLQTFYKGKALNFDIHKLLPMTQNLDPVELCVWTVCIWRKKTFLEHFEKYGHAVFSGKIGFYRIDPIRSIKISEEHEFRLAEMLIEAQGKIHSEEPQYFQG